MEKRKHSFKFNPEHCLTWQGASALEGAFSKIVLQSLLCYPQSVIMEGTVICNKLYVTTLLEIHSPGTCEVGTSPFNLFFISFFESFLKLYEHLSAKNLVLSSVFITILYGFFVLHTNSYSCPSRSKIDAFVRTFKLSRNVALCTKK